MEHVCCDLCGTDSSVPLLDRIDRFSGEVFHYVRCSECGLIYLNPRPEVDELLAYYPDDYEAYQPLAASTGVAHWRRRHALRILRRFVTHYRPCGRLLDVGCATGEFLEEMQAHGWAVNGVEINPRAASVARERLGVNVFAGSLVSYEAAEGAFDLVTLWDVLEHLPSPRAQLQRIHRLLSSEGRLILSIPNLRSFDARLFGRWWIGWDAPRHLHLFPDSALSRLLARTGFEIEAQRCLLGGPGAFQLSLEFWREQRAGSQSARGRAARFLFPLLPYALWPYKEVSYALRRGPVMTVVAHKMDGFDPSLCQRPLRPPACCGG